MSLTVAERIVLEPLTRSKPPAADQSYSLVDEILVYAKLEKKWAGLFDVEHVEGRMVTVFYNTNE